MAQARAIELNLPMYNSDPEDMSDGSESIEGQGPIDVLLSKCERQNMRLLQIKQELQTQTLISKQGQCFALMINQFCESQTKLFGQYNPKSSLPVQNEFPILFHSATELFLKNHEAAGIEMPFQVFSAIMSRLRWKCEEMHQEQLTQLELGSVRDYNQETHDLKLNEFREWVALDGYYLLEPFIFPMSIPQSRAIIQEYQLRQAYKILGSQVLKTHCLQMGPFQRAVWMGKRFFGCNDYAF